MKKNEIMIMIFSQDQIWGKVGAFLGQKKS
jgi:hypothetical protein